VCVLLFGCEIFGVGTTLISSYIKFGVSAHDLCCRSLHFIFLFPPLPRSKKKKTIAFVLAQKTLATTVCRWIRHPGPVAITTDHHPSVAISVRLPAELHHCRLFAETLKNPIHQPLICEIPNFTTPVPQIHPPFLTKLFLCLDYPLNFVQNNWGKSHQFLHQLIGHQTANPKLWTTYCLQIDGDSAFGRWQRGRTPSSSCHISVGRPSFCRKRWVDDHRRVAVVVAVQEPSFCGVRITCGCAIAIVVQRRLQRHLSNHSKFATH